MQWTDPDAPRLWRSWDILPYRNEPLMALDACSDDTLARIAAEGFTGIWFFCCLRELMQSRVFPQLNYHGEFRGYKYDAQTIRNKIAAMRGQL